MCVPASAAPASLRVVVHLIATRARAVTLVSAGIVVVAFAIGSTVIPRMDAGSAQFAELQDAEPGTFYLTDFLAKHFDALVWQGLGLDDHPELRDLYFGNYTRVVLLSQTEDPLVVVAGEQAAARLGLRFEHRHVAPGGALRRDRLNVAFFDYNAFASVAFAACALGDLALG